MENLKPGTGPLTNPTYYEHLFKALPLQLFLAGLSLGLRRVRVRAGARWLGLRRVRVRAGALWLGLRRVRVRAGALWLGLRRVRVRAGAPRLGLRRVLVPRRAPSLLGRIAVEGRLDDHFPRLRVLMVTLRTGMTARAGGAPGTLLGWQGKSTASLGAVRLARQRRRRRRCGSEVCGRLHPRPLVWIGVAFCVWITCRTRSAHRSRCGTSTFVTHCSRCAIKELACGRRTCVRRVARAAPGGRVGEVAARAGAIVLADCGKSRDGRQQQQQRSATHCCRPGVWPHEHTRHVRGSSSGRWAWTT